MPLDRSMFHAGDSDSTGVIAACWFGVAHGISSVPEKNHSVIATSTIDLM